MTRLEFHDPSGSSRAADGKWPTGALVFLLRDPLSAELRRSVDDVFEAFVTDGVVETRADCVFVDSATRALSEPWSLCESPLLKDPTALANTLATNAREHPGASASVLAQDAVREAAAAQEASNTLRYYVGASQQLLLSQGPVVAVPVVAVELREEKRYTAGGDLREDEERWVLTHSAIEAVAHATCAAAAHWLQPYATDGGAAMVTPLDETEIIRTGARIFVRDVVKRVRRNGYDDSVGALFDHMNEIVAHEYEGREPRARIILGRSDHPDITLHVSLTPPVPFTDTRTVRKLLESCYGGLALVADGRDVRGFARVPVPAPDDVRPQDESLYAIEVLGRGTWEVRTSDERALLRVRHHRPELPGRQIDGADLERRLRVLGARDPVLTAGSVEAMAAAIVARRTGGLLVVHPAAESEAERLRSTAQRIEPAPLEPEVAAAFAGMDGAILLDSDGLCHAAGVILDGTALTYGERARGARFHAAQRYVEGPASQGFAVVVSVAGDLTVLPPAVAKATTTGDTPESPERLEL